VRLRTDILQVTQQTRTLGDLAECDPDPYAQDASSVFEDDGATCVLHDLKGMAAAGASPPPAPGGHASIVAWDER
jgi:hypothetical protein